MVSSDIENPVSDIRLSSVVPARVTGEGKVHELTNIDLAMKLHYVKGVYFFKSGAVQGWDIYDFKKPMFEWCEAYYIASGRVRRHENGRPFIKCNDSGVRVVEARCHHKSLNEWVLDMKDDPSLNDHLVYDHVLGPDLGFSPLAFVQFTWFKCGGLAVSLSWSHIVGDPFSAADYINMWGHLMTGHLPPLPKMPNNGNYKFPSSIQGKPFSLKVVDPVGDHWLTTNTSKMVTYSFQITSRQIQNLVSKFCESGQTVNLQPFDAISSIIWKILANIRGDLEPKIITIVKNGSQGNKEGNFPSNDQVISAVEANFRVANADPLKLAKLIAENKVDERKAIEEIMREEDGKSDVIIYGANLTFVNLEEANLYGLELKGHKPVFAYYSIGGVGDEGVIFILPGPKNDAEENSGGRTVTVTLPEHHIGELRNVLKKEWGI